MSRFRDFRTEARMVIDMFPDVDFATAEEICRESQSGEDAVNRILQDPSITQWKKKGAVQAKPPPPEWKQFTPNPANPGPKPRRNEQQEQQPRRNEQQPRRSEQQEQPRGQKRDNTDPRRNQERAPQKKYQPPKKQTKVAAAWTNLRLDGDDRPEGPVPAVAVPIAPVEPVVEVPVVVEPAVFQPKVHVEVPVVEQPKIVVEQPVGRTLSLPVELGQLKPNYDMFGTFAGPLNVMPQAMYNSYMMYPQYPPDGQPMPQMMQGQPMPYQYGFMCPAPPQQPVRGPTGLQENVQPVFVPPPQRPAMNGPPGFHPMNIMHMHDEVI